jgi:general secretion pathway protein L
MVAATARAAVRPILQALSDLGAASIAILTAPLDGAAAAASIKVYDQSGALDAKRVSRILLVVLLVAAGAAGLAGAADVAIGSSLEDRQLDLARRINERRAALRGGQIGATRTASAILDRRKQETPATVIVLEALSDILLITPMSPSCASRATSADRRHHARCAGVFEPGANASAHFARATFFAPTTRSPSDPGERFHIEARIEPINTPRT